MAASPQFITAPVVGGVAIATANTARNGTGTIGTVITAGAAGIELWWVRIKSTVTTTAGTVRLWIHDGTTYYLLAEIPVRANTVSATNPAFEATVPLTFPTSGDQVAPIALPNGYSLRASTEKAENFNIIAFGGSY